MSRKVKRKGDDESCRAEIRYSQSECLNGITSHRQQGQREAAMDRAAMTKQAAAKTPDTCGCLSTSAGHHKAKH